MPPEQRPADLASWTAAIEAKWTMRPTQVDPKEVRTAQRAATTALAEAGEVELARTAG
ncbi:hypothetical protein [Streptomyces sp. NPDC002644]